MTNQQQLQDLRQQREAALKAANHGLANALLYQIRLVKKAIMAEKV